MGRCLEPEGNGATRVRGVGEDPAPKQGAREAVERQQGRRQQLHGVTGRKERKVRRDKEDPSCTEYVNIVNVRYLVCKYY
jgi:hypothetical protein